MIRKMMVFGLLLRVTTSLYAVVPDYSNAFSDFKVKKAILRNVSDKSIQFDILTDRIKVLAPGEKHKVFAEPGHFFIMENFAKSQSCLIDDLTISNRKNVPVYTTIRTRKPITLNSGEEYFYNIEQAYISGISRDTEENSWLIDWEIKGDEIFAKVGSEFDGNQIEKLKRNHDYIPDIDICFIYPEGSQGEGNVAKYFNSILERIGVTVFNDHGGTNRRGRNYLDIVMHLLVDLHNRKMSEYSYLYLHTGSIAFALGNVHILGQFKQFLQVGKQDALPVSAQHGTRYPFYFTCPKTNFESFDPTCSSVFFCGGTWDNRHSVALDILDQESYFNWYGASILASKKSYRGFAPSVIDMIKMHRVALVLHSHIHIENEEPSARIFEAASAGAVIISDENLFVKRNFRDSVLYIDQNKSEEEIAEEIKKHYHWIKNHPVEAERLARASHKIFVENFTLEDQLIKIIQNHQETIILSGYKPLLPRHPFSNTYAAQQNKELNYLLGTVLFQKFRVQNSTHNDLDLVLSIYQNSSMHSEIAERFIVENIPAGQHSVRVLDAHSYLKAINGLGENQIVVTWNVDSGLMFNIKDQKTPDERMSILDSLDPLHLNNGVVEMRKHKIVFTGISRNNAPEIPTMIKLLEYVGGYFQDYQVIIFENDSNDGTKELYADWARENARVSIISEDFHNTKRPSIKFLADARNRYLDALWTSRYDEYDMVMMWDMDMAYSMDIRGIQDSFAKINAWDAVCSNGIFTQSGRMYDAFAFRDEQYQDTQFNNPHFWTKIMPLIQRVHPVPSSLVPIFSGFGGMAIYKKEAIRDCRYDSIIEDCEHVFFHRSAIDKNRMRMFMNPNQIIRYVHFS